MPGAGPVRSHANQGPYPGAHLGAAPMVCRYLRHHNGSHGATSPVTAVAIPEVRMLMETTHGHHLPLALV